MLEHLPQVFEPRVEKNGMVDHLTVHGTMNSGMEYYIRPSGSPKGSIAISLVVRVGSLNESDVQQGFSHFIEHLGFKGTVAFPQYELVKELQKIGVSYGPDVNASTHLTETRFRLSIPVDDNLSTLRKGLFIMSEWAFRMNISQNDIDEEKQVIFAEYRAKQGLSQRLVNRYWPKLFHENSLLSNRMPIGIPEVFMNASSSDLRDYYKTWYRPDNMMISIVGDVDGKVDVVKTLIDEYFASPSDESFLLAQRSFSFIHDFFPVHNSDVVISLADKDLHHFQISFEFFWPVHLSTFMNPDNEMKLKLLISMLSFRFNRIIRGNSQNPCVSSTVESEVANENHLLFHKYFSTVVHTRELLAGMSLFEINIKIALEDSSKSDFLRRFRSYILTLFYELKRIHNLGFHENELKLAKRKWIEKYQEIVRNEALTSSSDIATSIEKYWLNGKSHDLPNPQQQALSFIDSINHISLRDMNSLSQIIDCEICTDKSPYYADIFPALEELGVSLSKAFRIVSFQQACSGGLSDEELSNEIDRCRHLISSVEVVEWPCNILLDSFDVIAAAQSHLYASKLKEWRSKHQEYAVHSIDEELEIPSITSEMIGERLSHSFLAEIQTHHVVLKNGIHVCLRHMPKEAPEKIAMQAFALHGTSELDSKGSFITTIFDDMCRNGDFSVSLSDSTRNGDDEIFIGGNDMKDLENHSRCSVSFQKHYYHRGLGGSCPSSMIELLLAFLVLRLSSSQRFKEEDLHSLKTHLKLGIEREKNSPFYPFLERARVLTCGQSDNHEDPSHIDSISLSDVIDFHRKYFVDSVGEFVFVFTGDLLPVEDFVNLLNGYLGQLPVNHPTSVHHPIIQNPVEIRSNRARETCYFTCDSDKASAILGFAVRMPFEDREDVIFSLKQDIVLNILQSRLIESLRMKLGKVYSVSVEKSRNSLGEVSLYTIGFHCCREDVEQLFACIEEEIRLMGVTGVSVEEMQAVKEVMYKKHASNLSNLSYWLFWILDSFKSYRNLEASGFDFSPHSASTPTMVEDFLREAVAIRTLNRCDLIQSFTATDIQEIVPILFDLNRAVLIDLIPRNELDEVVAAVNEAT